MRRWLGWLGTGRYQSSFPWGFKMYAAFCPELRASRKMSPDAVSVSLPLMLTIGALKPGSVTKVCVSGLDLLAAGGSALAPRSSLPAVIAGRAMENEKLICFAPGAPDAVPAVADRKVAVTETRSPAENGRLGEKAVPWPAGWALRCPACRPLRDPTAVTL